MEKAPPPREHLVDAAYISAALLVERHEQQGITLRGPTRPTQGWQAQVEGATPSSSLRWIGRRRVRCPQGKWSVAWWDRGTGHAAVRSSWSLPLKIARLSRPDALHSSAAAGPARGPPQDQYEALRAAQRWYRSEEGKQGYKQRAGVEGTLS